MRFPQAIRRLAVLVLVALIGVTAGHAETRAPDPVDDPIFGDPDAVPKGFPDPLEPLNRGIFGMNRQFDRWLVSPLTEAYIWAVPGVARRSIRRFFANLNSPSVVANDLLQAEWRDAGVSTARLGINTTIGIAGFVDPATRLGFPEHHSDFGQTLALAGVDSGPYLIMPLLGPTTFRDGFGVLVDFAFRPSTYLLGSVVLAELIPGVPGVAGIQDQLIYGTIQGGGTGFVTREAHEAQLRALEESSVDFYATMRSAYYQNRQAAIWDRRGNHLPLTEWPPPAARLCRLRGPRSSLAGRFPVTRNLIVRSRRCSPTA